MIRNILSIHIALYYLPTDYHIYSARKPTVSVAEKNQHTAIQALLPSTCHSGALVKDSSSINLPLNTINVPGDGSCFFSCISVCLQGDISQATFYRQIICMLIYDNWYNWEDFVQVCHNNNVQTKEAYMQRMVNGHDYATACEVQAAAVLLQYTISIWLKGRRLDEGLHRYVDTYTLSRYGGGDDNGGNRNINLLLSGSHYKVLFMDSVVNKTQENSENEHDNLMPKSLHVNNLSREVIMHQGKYETSTPTEFRKGKHKSTNTETSRMKCRRLGVLYEEEEYSDTNKDRWNRNRRNTYRITKAENKVDNKCNDVNSALNAIKHDQFHNETTKQGQNSNRKNKYRLKRAEHNMNNNDDDHVNIVDDVERAMKSIKAFEEVQMAYTFNTCTICQECRLNMKMKYGICTRCYKDKNQVKMFSKENNMNPDDVPEELKGLSIVEEQLIC